MSDDSQSGGGFSWFIAGLGLGALLGVLYAPKAGRETREDVVNSAKEGTEYLKQRSRETADQVSTLVDRGKVQVNEYVAQGKDYIDRGRSQAEKAVYQAREFVQGQVEKVSAAVDAGKDAYQTTTVEPVVPNGTVL